MHINIDRLSAEELQQLQNQIANKLNKKVISKAEKQEACSALETKIQECLKLHFPTELSGKLNCQIEIEVVHDFDTADLEETLRQGNEPEFDRTAEVSVKFIKFNGDEDALQDLVDVIEEAVSNHFEYNYDAWESVFPIQAKEAQDAYAKWNETAAEVTEVLERLGIDTLESDADTEHDERVDRELEMNDQDDEEEDDDEDDDEEYEEEYEDDDEEDDDD